VIATAQRARQRGLTLIEVMIVLALMGVLMATMVFGSGAFIGASRRAAAGLFVAAVQKGLSHANTIGKPVRLSIDMTAGRLILEESNSAQALRGPAPSVEGEDAEAPSQADLAVAAAQAAGEEFLAAAADPSSGFSPIGLLGQDDDTPGRALDPSIKISKVQTEHDEEPITEGLAYIYFWPGGITERAIVQLGRGPTDDGVTVEISPLTGRARISRGKVDLPEGLGDGEEYSERDEQ
jgi:general secretion pathway protein H